jgi:hypothetical protein
MDYTKFDTKQFHVDGTYMQGNLFVQLAKSSDRKPSYDTAVKEQRHEQKVKNAIRLVVDNDPRTST